MNSYHKILQEIYFGCRAYGVTKLGGHTLVDKYFSLCVDFYIWATVNVFLAFVLNKDQTDFYFNSGVGLIVGLGIVIFNEIYFKLTKLKWKFEEKYRKLNSLRKKGYKIKGFFYLIFAFMAFFGSGAIMAYMKTKN